MVEQVVRDAAYPEESGEAFGMLVAIDQDELDDPIYLTDLGADAGAVWDDTLGWYVLTVGSIDYLVAPGLEVIPPGSSDEPSRGRLRIPNVDTRIGEAIEAMRTFASVSITIVLASDPTEAVADPFVGLELRNIRGDALTVEGDLSYPGLENEPYPMDRISASEFPAAYRALT